MKTATAQAVQQTVHWEEVPEIRPTQLKEFLKTSLKNKSPNIYSAMKKEGSLERYIEEKNEVIQQKMRQKVAKRLMASGHTMENWREAMQIMEQVWIETSEQITYG